MQFRRLPMLDRKSTVAFDRKFTARWMAEGYLRLYRALVSSTRPTVQLGVFTARSSGIGAGEPSFNRIDPKRT